MGRRWGKEESEDGLSCIPTGQQSLMWGLSATLHSVRQRSVPLK